MTNGQLSRIAGATALLLVLAAGVVKAAETPDAWVTMKTKVALMTTEGLQLVFRDDAIAELAEIAAEVNRNTENIGARRLHTVVEKLLEGLSFDAPEMNGREVVIDAAYVRERLRDIVKNEDLSRYIL